jgi:hypothetical protein
MARAKKEIKSAPIIGAEIKEPAARTTEEPEKKEAKGGNGKPKAAPAPAPVKKEAGPKKRQPNPWALAFREALDGKSATLDSIAKFASERTGRSETEGKYQTKVMLGTLLAFGFVKEAEDGTFSLTVKAR